MTAPRLHIRPARPADRGAVLAFCRHTWSFGDYIGEVWDAWLQDARGAFVVGEVDGRVMGLDKLSFLSAGEAFFEGLRIDPAYRGHGYAQQMQQHLLAEAERQGARVVRLLTAAGNSAVHIMAGRDGFRRLADLLLWSAERLAAEAEPPPGLRPLDAGRAAGAARTRLLQGPISAAMDGLLSYGWHVCECSGSRWAALVAAGDVLTTPEGDLIVLVPPPADGEAAWLAALAAPLDPSRLAPLLRAARQVAAACGYGELQAMLPRMPALEAALQAAGWQGDAGAAMVLFEKRLDSGDASGLP